jgi:hypothetical protein
VVIEKQIITVIFEPRFLPKIAAIWDVAPCSLVDITPMLAAVSISDISLSVYHTKLHNIAILPVKTGISPRFYCFCLLVLKD